MAWPFESIDYFDHGDLATPDGPWASKTDTASKITAEHYSDMTGRVTPFTGSYSMKVTPGATTTTAFLLDDATSILNAETGYFAFALYLPSNFVATTDARAIHLLRCFSVTPTETTSVGIEWSATESKWGGIASQTVGGADSAPSVFFDFDTWYWIEVEVAILTAASGTTTVYARKQGDESRVQIATASTGNGLAVTQTRFGGVQISHNDIEGSFYLDHYHYEDPLNGATISPPRVIFDEDVPFAAPRQLFVGAGKLNNISLIAGTATGTNELYVYDTDTAQVTDDKLVAILRNTVASETVDVSSPPITVQRGAYAVLRTSGTDEYNPTAAEGRGIASISPRYYGSRDLIRRLRGMR